MGVAEEEGAAAAAVPAAWAASVQKLMGEGRVERQPRSVQRACRRQGVAREEMVIMG